MTASAEAVGLPRSRQSAFFNRWIAGGQSPYREPQAITEVAAIDGPEESFPTMAHSQTDSQFPGDRLEVWTLEPDDFEGMYDTEMQGLRETLAAIKQSGVGSFLYGWLISINRGTGFGYPACVRFAEDRTYTGRELNNLTSGFDELGSFIMTHIRRLLPGDVETSNVFLNLFVDLGGVQVDPTIRGWVTSVAIDAEFVRQPVRLL